MAKKFITYNGTIVGDSGLTLLSVETSEPNPFTNTLSTSFDGVDDYVEIGSPASIQNLTSEITISAWIKAPKTFLTQQYTLASKGEYGAPGAQWTIQIYTANASNTNGGYFQIFPQSNGITDRQSLAFPTAIDDNQWHHIMCVNDGTDLKIYLDGVLDATGAGKGRTLYNGNRTLRLGRLTASSNNKLIGNLDEVAIFGTALGLSDAQSIYNGGVPNDITSFNPVSWWRMGDGSIYPTINDEIGGNDGTMTNMTSANFVNDVPTFSKKSIALDGVDDYVNCGSYANIDNTDTFSISMWVKIGTGGYVIGKNNTASYWGYRFQFSISPTTISVFTSNIAFRNTTLTLGSDWIHVVMVIDRTESLNMNRCKIYVDGNPIPNITYSNFAQVSSDSSPLIIGARQVGTTSPVINVPFGGTMDEVSIWSNALQQADIDEIYNSGVPNNLNDLSTPPLSWWRCGDNDTSPTLTDNGSGGNDGTMTNFTTFSTDVP
jgi:hypothetical protein